MSQLIEEPRLFENLCSTLYLGIGFILVKRNRGKPGIDGVRIEDFEANLDEELSQLQQELSNWTYQPSPVRRVEIPKPGGKGMRCDWHDSQLAGGSPAIVSSNTK
jgi:hypothetical protein